VLGAFAVGALVITVFKRRRASLVVRAFVDNAVEPKVGAAVSALVEEQLLRLARAERRARDGYDIDLVVAHVELLSEETNLAQAVEGIAEVPQLKLLVAVLSFVDSLIAKRRLAAGGELLPAGAEGSGVALALYRRKRLRARGALWSTSAGGSLAPAPLGAAAVGAAAGLPAGGAPPPPDPSPYYELAVPAAWWVQYEAARDLDARVGLITSSAESFALLSSGLELHRAGSLDLAAEAYAQALEVDPDNVAALFNLALVLARLTGFYLVSFLLVERARDALWRRYREEA